MPTKEHEKEKSSTTITSDDNTITITPEHPLYDMYAQMFATYSTAPLEPYSYTVTAVNNDSDKKTEAVKPADVPYDKYFEVEHENNVLKEIIVDLNKKIYNLERKLEHGRNR